MSTSRPPFALSTTSPDPGFWEWLRKKETLEQERVNPASLPLYAEIPIISPVRTGDSEDSTGTQISFEVDITYTNT